MPGQRSERTLTWVATASFAGLILLLWLPFDLRQTALVEWWGSSAVFDQEGSPFTRTGLLKTRVLAGVPYFLGSALTPDSYIGGNLLLALLIFARMAVPYAVARLVEPGRPAAAYVFALLFALYPADSMQLTLRAVGTHFAVVLYLLGAWLLVLYWRNRHPLALAGMWLALVSSLMTAPTAYGAMLVTPLLLLRMEGQLSRRLLWVSFLWYLVPALFCLYLFYATLLWPGPSYLDRIWIWNGGMSAYKWKSLGLSAALVYLRHFLTAWTGAISALFANPFHTALGLLAGVGASAVTWLHLRRTPVRAERHFQAWAWGRWAVLGAAVTFFGFLPFWPTSFRLGDWRVYFLSPLGAALVLVLLIAAIDRAARAAGRGFLALSGVLITLSVVAALAQAADFQEKSRLEQRLLADIALEAPALAGRATLVLLDATLDPEAALPAGFAEGQFFYPHGMTDALGFLYEDYESFRAVVICGPTTRAVCSFSEAGLMVDGRVSLPLEPGVVEGFAVPYEEMLVFSYREEVGLRIENELPWPAVGYNPRQLIIADSDRPRRFSTLLSESVREEKRRQQPGR